MTKHTPEAAPATSAAPTSAKPKAAVATLAKPKVQPLFGTAFEGETSAAIVACNDFLRMGAGRSVSGLARLYGAKSTNITSKNLQQPPKTSQKSLLGDPPTSSHATLKEWSTKFDWQGRAALFDIYEDELHNAQRVQALGEGLALEYERVEALKQLGQFLHDQVFEQGIEREHKVDVVCPDCHHTVTVTTDDLVRPYHNVWVQDVKQVGTGEKTQRVDIERFNGPLISEYRAVMDDLAKETGDRRASSNAERKLQALYARLDLNKLSDAQMDALSNSRGKEWFEILLEQYTFDD